METPTNEQENSATTPTPKKQRTRVGRKRTVFSKAPKPAWPVRGLWENAPPEEKTRAHAACVKVLEYWLGKKSKAAIAKEMSITPLRVWQLSQQALSGMMAGLLTQPRRRVTPEAFERQPGQTREALKKRILQLEKELSRTEDLVRVLRTAPWLNPDPESPEKGDSKHATKRKTKARASRGASTHRPLAAGKQPDEESARGNG